MDNDIDILYQKIEELGNDLRDAFQRIEALEKPNPAPSCDAPVTPAPKPQSLTEAVENLINAVDRGSERNGGSHFPIARHGWYIEMLRSALAAQKEREEAVGELVKELKPFIDDLRGIADYEQTNVGGRLWVETFQARAILAAIERLGGAK